MCVSGRGSLWGVIAWVGNVMESNLQQISHGPFEEQELLRKQERNRESERSMRKREDHHIDIFLLDKK